eukprot:TRINITY_DN105015_c0_g1_i1.p1 TRINITY_DN105015_c0_g1~~TRINITY_DN105015_c0_g1_i1.p1  ORF type:complete len:398 (-),score=32.91 TRINITY_DN105015_c0_g1_i1:353-1546(-)
MSRSRLSRTSTRTIETIRAPGATWAEDLKKYEDLKRNVVDEGLLQGPHARVKHGQVRKQERTFDPLLQRYRDSSTELQQRAAEEHERVGHLNRAKDIQILREQPFHIIRHESHLEALAPGVDPARQSRVADGRPRVPDTTLDYNLISNIPYSDHHWAAPELRPPCVQRSGSSKTRLVPAYTVKDYNILTNRYVDEHPDKSRQEKRLNLLEATQKYNVRNRFDPVLQQYTDPRKEARARAADDAHDVEMVVRAEAQMPPAYRGRESSFYDTVTHQVHDPGMLRARDQADDSRKTRYTNRYVAENNWHAQDIKGDHIRNTRALNRIGHARFAEETRRGFNIVSNQRFGRGSQAQTHYAAFPQPPPTPWEHAKMHRQADGGRPRSASATMRSSPTPRHHR